MEMEGDCLDNRLWERRGTVWATAWVTAWATAYGNGMLPLMEMVCYRFVQPLMETVCSFVYSLSTLCLAFIYTLSSTCLHRLWNW